MHSSHATRVTFSAFPKTAWIATGFVALFLVAAIKFVAVDAAPEIALYPFLASLGFALWPALTFAMVGTLEAGENGLSWRRRIGFAGSLTRREIARIERYGSRSNDSLGVRVVPTVGKPITFPRIKPESMIEVLENYGRGPEAERRPIPGQEAFGAYAEGRIPNSIR